MVLTYNSTDTYSYLEAGNKKGKDLLSLTVSVYQHALMAAILMSGMIIVRHHCNAQLYLEHIWLF